MNQTHKRKWEPNKTGLSTKSNSSTNIFTSTKDIHIQIYVYTGMNKIKERTFGITVVTNRFVYIYKLCIQQ